MFVPSLALALFAALIAALFAAKGEVPVWGIALVYTATGAAVFVALIALSIALERWRRRRRQQRTPIAVTKLRWRS